MTELNNKDYSETQQANNFEDFSQPRKPDNHLALSIVATIVSLITCCGWVSCIGVILGIIAIVFSTQVDSKYTMGDYIGAETSSKNARLLALIAIGTVILSIVLIIVNIILAGGIAAIMEQYQSTIEQYS